MEILYAQKERLPLSTTVITSIPLYNTLKKDSAFVQWQAAKPLHLFVFLSPDCPLCHNYAPVLNELQRTYKEQLQIHAIVPGRSYADSLVNQFVETFSLKYTILKDTRQQLTKYFKAAATPEVFLLNNSGNLLYRGAIDNWAVSLGKKRIKTTEYYLMDAVDKSLRHLPIATKYVAPVGCIINEY